MQLDSERTTNGLNLCVYLTYGGIIPMASKRCLEVIVEEIDRTSTLSGSAPGTIDRLSDHLSVLLGNFGDHLCCVGRDLRPV